MSAGRKLQTVTLEEYFAAEEVSEIRHEYVNGVVRAMAGGSNLHADIGGNVFAELKNALRGKRCKPCWADARVKLTTAEGQFVFYPDVSVVCESNLPKEPFQERPVVILEVLSPSTRKNDVREKLHAYLSVQSLRVYMVVEQDFPHVTCHRRTESGFKIELYDRLTDVIPLPEIEAELPLARIYEGVVFDEVAEG